MIAGRFAEGQSQRCSTGRGTLVAFFQLRSFESSYQLFLLEVCMRFLAILLALTVLGSTLVGCRAEGEVGHNMTSITPGR